MAEESISLATRYQAAWAEINQRLNARQISYLGHAAACAAIAAQFAEKLRSTSTPGTPATPAYFEFLWVLAPAIISLAFSCWIRSHDLTIGLLSAFCGACEDSASGAEPAWHSSRQRWQRASLMQRQWVEIAFLMLNTLLVELATLYCVKMWSTGNQTGLILVLAVNHFVLGLSSWIVLSIGQYRYRLRKLTYNLGILDPPLPNVYPSDLISWVTAVAFLLAVAGYLLHRKDPHFGTSWGPTGFSLGLAIVMRLLAARIDFNVRRRQYGAEEPAVVPPLSTSFWIWPGVMCIGAVVMLLVGRWHQGTDQIARMLAVLPNEVPFLMQLGAFLVTMILFGYGVPEQVLNWDRF